MNEKHFEGKPCKACGSNIRYKKFNGCVACYKANGKQRRQNDKEKINQYSRDSRKNNPLAYYRSQVKYYTKKVKSLQGADDKQSIWSLRDSKSKLKHSLKKVAELESKQEQISPMSYILEEIDCEGPIGRRLYRVDEEVDFRELVTKRFHQLSETHQHNVLTTIHFDRTTASAHDDEDTIRYRWCVLSDDGVFSDLAKAA